MYKQDIQYIFAPGNLPLISHGQIAVAPTRAEAQASLTLWQWHTDAKSESDQPGQEPPVSELEGPDGP